MTWPRDVHADNPLIVWLHDSRRWVEYQAKDENNLSANVLLYSLDSAIPKRVPDNFNVSSSSGPEFTGMWFTTLGITAADTGILADVSAAGGIDVHRFGLQGGAQSQTQATINLPPMTQIRECAPSPDGKQFAWLFCTTHAAPRLNAILRLLPHQRTYYTTAVWVSQVDGGGLRQITSDVDIAFGGGPYYVHWTPDGAQICYWSQKTLWTVPAS